MPEFSIWEGVYSSYVDAAAAVAGPGFNGPTWRARSLEGARTCLAALESGTPIPFTFKQRSVMLPPVVATMLASRPRVHVLDFGGGLGIGYMTLAESIPDVRAKVQYTIVEVPQVCDAGRSLLGGAVAYVDALPHAGAFDLVHAASAVQYEDDWRQLLRALAAYRAEFILLSDVYTGDIPSFVSLQNYYESRIRHWFFNFDELMAMFTEGGYRLAMQTPTRLQFRGVDGPPPMAEFPETHRLDRSLHLLLQRQ